MRVRLEVLLAALLVGSGVAANESDDHAAALRELIPLATQGDAEAQYRLGSMHQKGQGLPQDNRTAMSWYRKAAEQGHAAAQNALGIMYAKGTGVPQDYPTAVSWYRKAADQGEPGAQFNLGVMYYNGREVPSDHGAAADWFRKAAEAGNTPAQVNLGVMYEQGLGVARDYDAAMSWYRRAADVNDAGAQNAIGALYGNGLGVPIDYPTAMSWYRKSAEQGHGTAQNNLGYMYLNGEGAAADPVEAYKWFSLAASSNADARKNKEIASARMTPEQRTRAGQLVPGAASDSAPCPTRTADAHPDIKWGDTAAGSGNFWDCLLDHKTDESTIDVATYMSSGLYKFVRECRGDEGVITRVFEYKNSSRPYLLRLHQSVDPYTYVVISSYPRPNGTYHHQTGEKTNRAKGIKSCPAE